MRTFDVDELIVTILPDETAGEDLEILGCHEPRLSECPGQKKSWICGEKTKNKCEPDVTLPYPPITPKPKPKPGTPPEGELAALRRQLRSARRR